MSTILGTESLRWACDWAMGDFGGAANVSVSAKMCMEMLDRIKGLEEELAESNLAGTASYVRADREFDRRRRIEKLAQALFMHRDDDNIPTHHGLVCKTSEARDDLYALKVALENQHARTNMHQ